MRASVYGLAAAAAAAGLLGATHSLGFQVLLAALAGVGIGIAVRSGAGGRGGWPFMLAAALAAYVAVTLSFIPLAAERVEAGLLRVAAVCLALPFTAGDTRVWLWLMVGASMYMAMRLAGRAKPRGALPGPYRMQGSTGPGACPSCGADQPEALLVCPSCLRLVHGPRASGLLEQGRVAEHHGDLKGAITAWRAALEALPPGSLQHAAVLGEVRRLSGRVEEDPVPAPRPAGNLLQRGWLGLVAVLVFLVTKGKFLLMGLTKAPTLLSMLATIGVYMSLFGWRFAAGFIACLYVHEMGHVWMMSRYGIRASAPMFIPGLGAFVRMQQYPVTVREDARVGLAGPIWGLAAAGVCMAAWAATGSGLWGALAKFGAWLNLFNLLPVWQFDGGRGFRALTRPHRWIAAAVLAGAAWATGWDTLVVILTLAGAARALWGEAPKDRDDGALVQYVLLVGLLTWIFLMIPLPEVPAGD
jgi:Zn-dependent protease